jgi:hypothetical protein
MKTILRILYALSVCGATAILTGCGGSTSPSYQPPVMSQSPRAYSVSSAVTVHDASCQGQRSFQYVGHAQRFKVPKCAASIYIDARGAAGGGCCGVVGSGGEVSATIPVTRGEKLIVTLGGAGHNAKGGFNGGAAGVVIRFRSHHRRFTINGGGGGGASDVRQGGSTLVDRVVVAGGGGGEDGSTGGAGGGLPNGGSGGTPYCEIIGNPIGGGGGTQSSGGSGGAGNNGGSLGNGGVGVGDGGNVYHGNTYPSGGGGSGYYGGGGGNGGAGSGYAEPSATNVSSQNGVNSGKESVLICWGYSNAECGSRQKL